MHSTIRSVALTVALLAASSACQRGDTDGRAAAVQTDSGAMASAAAEAIVSSLRGTTLSDTAPRRKWLLAPGPTSWDTLLVDEIRRAEPSMAEEVDDTSLVTTVSTHGFASRGDTVAVTVVVRSCVGSDTVLNFTKDSLVHRLVRARENGSGTWRLVEPISHDHAIGECEPIPTPGSDSL